MKVYFYSYKSFEGPYLEAVNQHRFETGATQEVLSLKTAGLAWGYDVISIFTADDASAPVLEELFKAGVRFIAIRAAGYDNVDIAKATELGISVANVPAYSPYSVAEHAVGMMLALNRKLLLADKQVHDHNFSLDNLIGFDMYQKTVGIIGTGRIGSVVARILHGFGCNILAYDLQPNLELKSRYGVNYVSPDHICSYSDIITLHLPHNSHTHHFVDRKMLGRMKEGVMLINTSRGAVINTIDLLHFLINGHIGCAGLDVYENERGLFFYDHSGKPLADEVIQRLLEMPNVLITPHQAFATVQALSNIATATYDNISCWKTGKNSPNELTKKRNVYWFVKSNNKV